MLDKTVFISEFDKLKANFQRNMPDRWQEFYWKELQWWENDEFTKSCTHIVNTDDFFPKLKRFTEVRRKIREQAGAYKKVAYAGDCEWCDGHGYLYVEEGGRPGVGAMYRARCEHGAQWTKMDLAPENITRKGAHEIWFNNNWKTLETAIDKLEADGLFGVTKSQELLARAKAKIASKKEELSSSVPF